jgi:phosphonate transport system permease protein
LFYLGLLTLALVTIKMPIISSFGYLDEIFKTSADLFPPDFNTARPEIIRGILETIAIGFVATVLGLLIALPLALLAARNIVINRIVYSGTRLFMLAFRGIPELIVAVLFVSAMGLGPVPGTLALTLGTAFFMAKLIADTLEEVAPEPRDAIFATGATRSQEFFAAVLPQAMPNLISQTLYLLDVNLRSSTVLGIVGGGGIGFLLLSALRVLEYQTVGAILILTFVVVYAIELLGSWVRNLVE